MDSNGDGIDEEVAALVRTAVAFGARMAEEIARERARQARRAEADSEQRRVESQARVDAERAAARAQLDPVLDDQWWSTATPERIGVAYEAAAAWEPNDEVAGRAAERIRVEVQQRYGVDIDAVVREARTVHTDIERAAVKDLAELSPDERRLMYFEAQRWLAGIDPELGERISVRVLEARTEADCVTAQNDAIAAHRRRLAAEIEVAEAVGLAEVVDGRDDERGRAVHERVDTIVRGADVARAERMAQEALAPGYDSEERRRLLAAALASAADSEEVQARILDDLQNALPPAAAVHRDRRHPTAGTPHDAPLGIDVGQDR